MCKCNAFLPKPRAGFHVLSFAVLSEYALKNRYLVDREKKKNRLNLSVEDVSQKDYAITKRRSFASFLSTASQKQRVESCKGSKAQKVSSRNLAAQRVAIADVFLPNEHVIYQLPHSSPSAFSPCWSDRPQIFTSPSRSESTSFAFFSSRIAILTARLRNLDCLNTDTNSGLPSV